MRISDCSSDVCSSDLEVQCHDVKQRGVRSAQFDLYGVIVDRLNTGELFRLAGLEILKAFKCGVVAYARRLRRRLAGAIKRRSAERRVGKEWVSTWRSRWSQYH